MEMIGGIIGFIFLMAIISMVAPAVGHAFEALFGLGAMAVIGYVLFLLAKAGGRAVRRGAEIADYLLVKHPAEPIVNPALREGRELDVRALHDALMPTPRDLDLSKPLYHYEHQAEKARALKQKLDDNADLAEAAIRHERAWAALQQAEQEFEEAKRRTKGRRS